MTTLACVGDLLSLKSQQYPSDPEIATILGESDLRFGNLETTFATKGTQAQKLVALKSEPGVEMRIQKLGFNILSMANNHMLDYGYDGLFDTIAVVEGLGIKRIGVGKNIYEALEPAKMELNSTMLAFIGFASTLPAGFAAGPNKPGIAPLRVMTKYYIDPNMELENPGLLPAVFTEPVDEDLQRILSVVRRLRPQVDVLCVSVHWGVPFQDEVMDYQKVVAHALIDAGVDAIIGHHPHVLHGIEIYKGKPILYSLGHFIMDLPSYGGSEVEKVFDANPQIRNYKVVYSNPDIMDASGIAYICFEKDRVKEVKFVPTLAIAEGPKLAKKKQAQNILLRLKMLSERFGLAIKIKDDKGSIEI